MATVQQFLDNSFNNKSQSNLEQATNSPSNIIPYMLFVYREELRRLNKNAHSMKLSKSKLHLTQELVSYSVDRITEYDMQELMNINRQISFTRKLKSRMDHMKQMQKYRSLQAQVVNRS
ncbi:hypothetical protein FF38_07976 [Lucilia cuprina]|uniref:Uncharacterized protein n=1 Tax=Lucilia cuprina TaxID=7375 RepID=A0A0L0C6C5_LUCCU|nr:hypothetical protein CVS40_3987 [Lucilia cuprina]KNC27802.1 hypothetical protein FF38_07976 [Lucilia cuprina]